MVVKTVLSLSETKQVGGPNTYYKLSSVIMALVTSRVRTLCLK